MRKRILALLLTATVASVNIMPAVKIQAQEIQNESNTYEETMESEYPELTLENLSYGLGYQQLGEEENGEALQEAYDRIVEAAWEFYYSDRNAEDIVDAVDSTCIHENMAAAVDVSDLGLSWDDMQKIKKNFDVDASFFYFLFDAFGGTLFWSKDENSNTAVFYLPVTTYIDEETGEDLVDYADGSKREAIRTIIEDKLHEYWDLTKNLSTEEEKERAIAWKIMEEVTYDDERTWIPYNHNILGVLRNGMTVCEGYARTMQVACSYCGLDCIYVEGAAVVGAESHAWNKVKLGDEWFDVDITWEDGIDTNDEVIERYYDGSLFMEKAPEFMIYVNMPHELFLKSHTENDMYYPESSESDAHWNRYIMNAEENGSTREEQTASFKAYLKKQLLKGNMAIGLIYKGDTYDYYSVFQPAFEEVAQELESEIGRSYELTPGFMFRSNSVFATSGQGETWMLMYVGFSEKKETDNSVYYVGNIPGKGIYLCDYFDDSDSIRMVIPESIENRNVTVVTYANTKNVSQLVLPSTCICYGSNNEIKQVVVPDSLREINGLHETINAIYLPAGVKTIDIYALGYTDWQGTKISDFTIYGYAGTKAESYAVENDFNFVDVTGKELIEQVAISDVEFPSAGSKVEDSTLNISLENMSVKNIAWNTEDTVFEKGKKYEVEITLQAAEGYAFTPNTLFDINETAVSAELTGSDTVVIRWSAASEEGNAPFIQEDGEIQGWEAIKEQTNAAENGTDFCIDMNGETEVPGDVLDSISGKDVTLTFKMENDIVWSVDGIAISSELQKDVDLSVTKTAKEAGNISADTIIGLAGNREAE